MKIIFYRSHDFLDVVSSYDPAVKQDERSGKAFPHKYLKVALLADENVAARHGNQTSNFLLVLANIVSGWDFSINTIFNLCVFVTKSISPSVVTDCIATDR